MTRVTAIVPTDLNRSALGLPSRVAARFGDTTVLGHTLQRLATCRELDDILLLHPAEQHLGSVPDQGAGGRTTPRPVPADGPLWDRFHPRRLSARKWSLHAWRGGLGGATCFDELLSPQPMAAAARGVKADAVLIVGPDWPFVDPVLCDRIIARYREAPGARQMTFSQAPPGLAGLVIATGLLEDLADQVNGMIGHVLDYVPSRPQPDPIGRDMCVSIEPVVRDMRERLVFDTPRGAALLVAVSASLGPDALDADAARVATEVAGHRPDLVHRFGPRQVTLELTPRRAAGIGGSLVPQAHVALDRPDMDLDLALRIVEQIAALPDVTLRLGGLGDALAFDSWRQVVQAAGNAGVFGLAMDTDLTCDETVVHELLEMPIDVLTVRLNADTATIYAQAMADTGTDDLALFTRTTGNLETYLNTLRHRLATGTTPTWLVPRLVKTKQTLPDMEAFFDRWTHFAGHAVIEPAQPGRGEHGDLMPGGGMVTMASPQRRGCRQVEQRLTILSNGVVAQCDQDWLAARPLGDARAQGLSDIWLGARILREDHQAGRWNQHRLCSECRQWNRP